MPAEAPPLAPLAPLHVVPLSADYQGQQAYLPPGADDWMPLTADAYQVLKGVEPDDANVISSNRSRLSEMFSSALQVPNLGFFAGSGTSLGDPGGPSMWTLWQDSMCDPQTHALTAAGQQVTERVRYAERENPNI